MKTRSTNLPPGLYTAFFYILFLPFVQATPVPERPADRPHNIEKRVLHGEPDSGRIPWAVQFFSQSGEECSASLVGNRWVLTAAHCVKDNVDNPGVLTVFFSNLPDG